MWVAMPTAEKAAKSVRMEDARRDEMLEGVRANGWGRAGNEGRCVYQSPARLPSASNGKSTRRG